MSFHAGPAVWDQGLNRIGLQGRAAAAVRAWSSGCAVVAGWQDIEARRVTRFPGRPGSLASPGRSAGPRLLMRGVWLIELPAS